ncbi:MAG: ABC transporter permease [Pseudomonadales bacterium]
MTEEQSFWGALLLIFQWGGDLWEIIGLSLRVSLTAVAIATVLGLPIGALLALRRFRGQHVITVTVNTLMSLPPVVVGLLVYILLSRAGPLGVFGLLFTPTAMIIAQTILITPIVVALSRQHLQLEWERIGEQLRSFGIGRLSAMPTLFWETRAALGTVVLAGFGRAIAEIGAVMIVGGNIDHLTRVMTTAIALETSKGNLELAVALGVVLLTMALLVNAAVHGLSHWSSIRGGRT